MMKLRHILALNIKKRRQSLGFSQSKLAEMADTAPTYIAMIELEKRSPSFEMLERIAEALKIDPPELFSKTAYSIEAVEQFHSSVLAGFEEVIQNQTAKFIKKINNGRTA